MYYYIAEPPQTKQDQAVITALRAQLIPEGIAGEFVFRTPGQSAARLARAALGQGFSTVVAVGNDSLASEIASALYDEQAALGVVPMHASDSLLQLLGYTDWKAAIQTLRHRKLILHDLGTVNGDYFFLTNVVVRSSKPTKLSLHMDRFTAMLQTDELHVILSTEHEPFSVPGVINFTVFKHKNAPLWTKSLFGKRELNIETLLRSEQAVLQCRDTAVIYQGSHEIAETPASLAVIPQAVRIIVARQMRT